MKKYYSSMLNKNEKRLSNREKVTSFGQNTATSFRKTKEDGELQGKKIEGGYLRAGLMSERLPMKSNANSGLKSQTSGVKNSDSSQHMNKDKMTLKSPKAKTYGLITRSECKVVTSFKTPKNLTNSAQPMKDSGLEKEDRVIKLSDGPLSFDSIQSFKKLPVLIKEVAKPTPETINTSPRRSLSTNHKISSQGSGKDAEKVRLKTTHEEYDDDALQNLIESFVLTDKQRNVEINDNSPRNGTIRKPSASYKRARKNCEARDELNKRGGSLGRTKCADLGLPIIEELAHLEIPQDLSENIGKDLADVLSLDKNDESSADEIGFEMFVKRVPSHEHMLGSVRENTVQILKATYKDPLTDLNYRNKLSHSSNSNEDDHGQQPFKEESTPTIEAKLNYQPESDHRLPSFRSPGNTSEVRGQFESESYIDTVVDTNNLEVALQNHSISEVVAEPCQKHEERPDQHMSMRRVITFASVPIMNEGVNQLESFKKSIYINIEVSKETIDLSMPGNMLGVNQQPNVNKTTNTELEAVKKNLLSDTSNSDTDLDVEDTKDLKGYSKTEERSRKRRTEIKKMVASNIHATQKSRRESNCLMLINSGDPEPDEEVLSNWIGKGEEIKPRAQSYRMSNISSTENPSNLKTLEESSAIKERPKAQKSPKNKSDDFIGIQICLPQGKSSSQKQVKPKPKVSFQTSGNSDAEIGWPYNTPQEDKIKPASVKADVNIPKNKFSYPDGFMNFISDDKATEKIFTTDNHKSFTDTPKPSTDGKSSQKEIETLEKGVIVMQKVWRAKQDNRPKELTMKDLFKKFVEIKRKSEKAARHDQRTNGNQSMGYSTVTIQREFTQYLESIPKNVFDQKSIASLTQKLSVFLRSATDQK